MATSVWTLGSLVSTITFKKTNAEMADLLLWLVKDLTPPEGLTVAQANQWKLDEAHKRAMQAIMQHIRENQIAAAQQEEYEKFIGSQQARITTIKSETSIVEEPEFAVPISPPYLPPA